MKKIKKSLAVSAIAAIGCIAGVYGLLNSEKESKSALTIANIEALSSGESPIHLWCCGTTGICAQGTNAAIIGKISETPCK